MQQEQKQVIFEHSFWINKLDHTNPTQVEPLVEHKIIHHVYDPEDQESYTGDEYRDITYNRYHFEYPPLWRNIYNKELSIVLRSINSSPFPRTLVLSGLQLWYCPDPTLVPSTPASSTPATIVNHPDYLIDKELPGPIHMNFSINISLPSREGMTEANAGIQNQLLQLYQNQPEQYYPVWNKAPIQIFYDYQKSDLTFNITHSKYLLRFEERTLNMNSDFENYSGTTRRDFYSIGPGFNASSTSPGHIPGSNYDYDDWKSRTDFYNPKIWFYGIGCEMKGTFNTDHYEVMYGITQMKIKNIWGRERMIVKSNLDPYDEYLGYTNTTFGPPKQFPVNKQDNHFWIELYDAVSREHICMPPDGKDTVVIEAQFIAT
jgi:hypothetical protein